MGYKHEGQPTWELNLFLWHFPNGSFPQLIKGLQNFNLLILIYSGHLCYTKMHAKMKLTLKVTRLWSLMGFRKTFVNAAINHTKRSTRRVGFNGFPCIFVYDEWCISELTHTLFCSLTTPGGSLAPNVNMNLQNSDKVSREIFSH